LIAYVGSRTTAERQGHGKGLSVYHIDPTTGRWTLAQLLETTNPTFLTLDRTNRFLYAVHGDLTTVSAYAVTPGSGLLTPRGEQDTGGRNPVHIAVAPANRFVVISNHSSGSVVSLPIRPDGTLGPVAGELEPTGPPGPHRTEQTGSKPHQAVFDPSGRFLAIPDKGLDRILIAELAPESGRLAAVGSVPTREMAGPRHLAFHPTLPFAYCVDELRSTVTTYRWDGGTLEPLRILPSTATTFTGDSRGGAILVEPGGRFVYATNRGGAGDSAPGGPDPDTIGIFRVDRRTGLLDGVGWQSTFGIRPRFACLGVGGRGLYVANEGSDSIVGYDIDGSGTLTPTGQTVTTGSPVCLAFLA
jgi:6-phosphogluconolactonase